MTTTTGTGIAGADMPWLLSTRADPVARRLADRHYSRQTVGARQFVPPGRCCVFVTACERAYWVTSWPFAEFVKHEWAGAWVNSAFRNEGAGVASELILSALSATLAFWRRPPDLGMVTFIDPSKVRPTIVRGHCTWGRSYLKAGFRHVGKTKGGLLAFQILPAQMPHPQPARRRQPDLFGATQS
jgi:hypothetical protein